MSDYIDILLTALEDELYPSLGKDYFLPLQQANDALTALSATPPISSVRCWIPMRTPPPPQAAPIRTPTPAGPSSSRGRSTVKRPRRTAPRCCCR